MSAPSFLAILVIASGIFLKSIERRQFGFEYALL
jgi:hypothetical protein